MIPSWRRHDPGRTAGLVLLAAALLAVAVSGCQRRRHMAQPGEDPFDRIVIASFDSTGAMQREIRQLPRNAYKARWRWPWTRWRAPQRVLARPARIDSTLQEWVADSAGTKVDTLIVTFDERVEFPRFPEPDMQQPRTAPVNDSLLAAAQALITSIEAQRDSQYTADSLDLASHFDATILRRYWIAQALKVTMPLNQVNPLSARPGVVFIQRNRSGIPPPAMGEDGNPANDIVQGRKEIVSDPYYDLGYTYGWISLLDTGVRTTHTVFQGEPSPIGRWGDCTDGSANCGGVDADDVDVVHAGHGTSSANILVGNNPDYPAFRGVTGATLDCFRVYDPPGATANATLNIDAVLVGLQTATARLDRVYVAEMQDDSPEAAAIGVAANNAFKDGGTVIAANGDNTTYGIGIPASARCAIGVGAFDVETRGLSASQSYGTTDDGRIKPDVQGPTSSETAGDAGDEARNYHTATSGATPYVAGGAALLRNWLKWAAGGTGIDPGQVYAQLILSGRTPGPYEAGSKVGAGPIELPTRGWGMFGKVRLDPGHTGVTIPIGITHPGIVRLEAALWWPEILVTTDGVPVDTHNNIDLELVDPEGTVRATSAGADGVFERASADVAGSEGAWSLRVTATELRTDSQVVYWTVALRK